MKACISIVFLFLFTVLSLSGQFQVKGFVYDSQEEPFIGLEVELKGEDVKLHTLTDETGQFIFSDVAKGDYQLLVITPYGLINKEYSIRSSIELHLQKSRTVKTDEVVVNAVRAQNNVPVTAENVDMELARDRNIGLDAPYLLQWTTSAVASSDAGNGIGYTGLRIRGTDPTRTNVTINGVPLNDAESQGVFWVDLPDFFSSAESIQIQRGVGSSTFGGGAFGASININTVKTQTDPSVRLSAGIGSFNTLKGSIELASGLIANHLSASGRLSYIQSDGYIDRASADLQSFYLSTAWLERKSSVRLNIFSGKEVTYQAWNGVPATYISDPELRTFNTAGAEKPGDPYEDEVDDYVQTHYQLIANQEITSQLHSYLTFHYTRGKGFYEQYKGVDFFDSSFEDFLSTYGLSDEDAVRRRWLDNHYYGAIGGFQFYDPTDRFDLQVGGALHRYDGKHFGEVTQSFSGMSVDDLPHYYENSADKRDGSIFMKINHALGEDSRIYVDLQYRGVKYAFEGPDQDGDLTDQEVKLNFFNPKLGLVHVFSEKMNAYASFGVANKEPNRDDYVDAGPGSRPEAERLYNTELGLEYKASDLSVGLNFYHMLYRDQLVLTGEINDVGAYTRTNVEKSYRLGSELNLSWTPVPLIDIGYSLSLSQNRIPDFTEYVDNWDYYNQDFSLPEDQLDPLQFERELENTDIAFSPSVLTSGQLMFRAVRKEDITLSAGLLGKYVGQQYIDNSSNPESKLDGYFFTDFLLTSDWKFEKFAVSVNLTVRNLLDELYSSNAWIYRFQSEDYDPRPDDPYAELENGAASTYHLRGLYPQAGRNFLLGVSVQF